MPSCWWIFKKKKPKKVFCIVGKSPSARFIRGAFRDEPSQSPAATAVPLFVACRRHLPPAGGSLSKGRALGRTSKFRPHRSTAGRSLPLSSKLFAFAKASPFRERWHGEAVTERVAFGTNPLSLAALDSCSPFCRLSATSSPGRGKSFEGESPWQNRQVSSTPVNGRKKPAVKQQTFRLCQSLSLSGEVARRSRDGEGRFRDEPSQSPAATALPKGRALGRTSKFRPHRSTAEEVNR